MKKRDFFVLDDAKKNNRLFTFVRFRLLPRGFVCVRSFLKARFDRRSEQSTRAMLLSVK